MGMRIWGQSKGEEECEGEGEGHLGFWARERKII
jgi:hypothetical protein